MAHCGLRPQSVHQLGGYKVQRDSLRITFADGRTVPVGLPASFEASYTSAQTINDNSDVVGFYNDAAGASHGATAFRKGDGPVAGKAAARGR